MQTARLLKFEEVEYILEALKHFNKPLPKMLLELQDSRDICLFDIPFGATAFACWAYRRKFEGLLFGVCPDPHGSWKITMIPDPGWDLYCEHINSDVKQIGKI